MSESYAQIPLSETTEEEWRSIADFVGIYEVSNLGRVRRIVASTRGHAGRMQCGGLDPKGYPAVHLSNGNRRRVKKIHALVCEAFNGPRPDGHVCNHIDAIKTHNVPSNLEWVTRAENVYHAQSLGLLAGAKGEANSHAVLTADDVRDIRRRYAAGGVLQREIGAEYGVAQVTISEIVARKLWTHVL